MADLDTKVALVENDVQRLAGIATKTELAIERISEVSNNLAKMIAVHEERISHHETVNQELFTLVEKRKDDLQEDIKELHSRITTVSRELSDDITETERRLVTALQVGLQDVKRCITDEYATAGPKQEELEKRIADLEKWRWLVIGGSIILGTFAHEIVGSFIGN